MHDISHDIHVILKIALMIVSKLQPIHQSIKSTLDSCTH